MKSDLPLVWWRPEIASAAPPVRAAAHGRLAFAAVAAYTVVLVAAPQEFFVSLQALRLALALACIAFVAHLWDRSTGRVAAGRVPLETRIIVLILAWAVATLPFSFWPSGSVQVLLDIFLKSIAIYLLLGGVVNSRERFLTLGWVLTGCIAVIALSAVRNYQTGVHLENAPGRITGYGTSGLAGNPNDLALLICIILPLTLSTAAMATRALWRMVALAIAALGVVGVIVTFSRSGFLALVVIALLYLWRARGGSRLLAIGAALVVVMLLPVVGPAGYVDRIGSATNWEADTSGSAENRWRDMVAATEFVATHPVFGAGIGMDFLALNTQRGNAWLPVHNAYLGYAVDLGLPGLVLFVSLLVACVRGVARVEREAGRRDPVGHMAGALLVSLVAFAVAASFYPISYHPFFYYLAGLGVAAQRIHASEARAA